MRTRSIPTVILCFSVALAAACNHRPSPPASLANNRPLSLLAALGERLAVVDSSDGTAKYLPGRYTEVSRVAVTGGGEVAVVVNGSRDCRTTGGFEEGSYQPEIDHVGIVTGVRERVVGGSDFPVVNSKAVALVPSIAVADAEALVAYGIVCDGPGLGFTDMVSGQNARRPPLGEAGYTSSLPIESVRPLGWLRDGRTLFYMVSVRTEPYPRYYFGRVWPLVEPGDELILRVAAMPLSEELPTTAALVDDMTIAFAQHAHGGGSQVREWDVRTGRFRDGRLFELPGTITDLATDASGRHFLAITRNRHLYRWSAGDARPVQLAEDVTAAAWIQ